MKRIFDQAVALASSRTAKDTYILSLGNVVAAVLAVVFTILAARVLEPEGWGIVAAVISFIVIVEAIGDLGLGSALFRFVSSELAQGSDQKGERILRVVFFIRLVTAFLILIALSVFSGFVSKLVFGFSEPMLVTLAGVAVFGYLLLDFQITAFQAKQRWILSASFIVFTNLLRILLLLFLLWQGSVSIITVLALFAATPVLAFLATLFWQKASFKVENNWEAVAGRIASFSGWLGVNRVSSAAASRLDVLLLLTLVGAYQTGIYSAAKQLIIGVPLVVGSVATVIAPKFAVAKNKDLAGFFKKTVLLSILLSVGLVVGIFLTPWIIQLFGPKYEPSAPVLQLLFLGYVPFVLSMPAVNVLIYAFGKTKIIAFLALVQLPVVYFGNLFAIPRLGVFAPVLLTGLVNLSTAVVTYLFALSYLKKK